MASVDAYASILREGDAGALRPPLWGTVTLLTAEHAARVARPLGALFAESRRAGVAAALVAASIVTAIAGVGDLVGGYPTVHAWLTTAVFLLASLFVHELGHIAAAVRSGVRSGRIGFGIYLCFPVFFADLNASRSATRTDRLYISAAGVLAQVALAVSTFAVASTFGFQVLANAATASIILATFQIVPLLRNDGYWFLSDAIDVINLGRGQAVSASNQSAPLSRRKLIAIYAFRAINAVALLVAIIYSFMDMGHVLRLAAASLDSGHLSTGLMSVRTVTVVIIWSVLCRSVLWPEIVRCVRHLMAPPKAAIDV